VTVTYYLTGILYLWYKILMGRSARIVAAGTPHHITQRGNNRQDVFPCEDDFGLYLEILNAQSRKWAMEIHAYCLMNNHVHLIATPRNPGSLAKAVGRTHYRYALLANRTHGSSGHLWQNRFYSCILDDGNHLLAAIRYVERNPVRAGMVGHAWDYPWSSAAAHLSGKDVNGLLDMHRWAIWSHNIDWRARLSGEDSEEFLAQVRTSTHRGNALAGDDFIEKLEKHLGKSLRPLPVGRPKKK
jgi:REP-associated tyrosine transposase